jgi:hypothetical protein
MTAISLPAAEAALNVLTGNFNLVVQSSTPSYTPGMWWWNTASGGGALYAYSGNPLVGLSGWVNLSQRYIALLYQDPSTSGGGGGPATSISDLVECTDAGYSRQLVTFTPAAPGSNGTLPVIASNTANVTFSFPQGMTGYASWVALVTAASGTAGLLLQTWDVPSQYTQNVGPGQSITYPAGAIVLEQD